MKKLTLAIVLMGASFTFANAQSTETVKHDTGEMSATKATEMKTDTTVMVPATETATAETMKMEEPMSAEAMKAEEAAKAAQSQADMKKREKMEKKKESKK